MKAVTSSLLIKNLIFPVYFLLVVFIAIYTYNRPAYNPDMLVYMAIANGIDKSNFTDIHAKVFQDAKKYLPAPAYSNFTDPVMTPVTMIYHDTNRLYQLIPQYAVKPLYILSIQFFKFIGFNPLKATMVPTILSFIILGLIVFKWILIYYDSIIPLC